MNIKDFNAEKVCTFNQAYIWGFEDVKLDVVLVLSIWSKSCKDGDGVISLHQPQLLHHVPNPPVRLPAGDPLQHDFKTLHG